MTANLGKAPCQKCGKIVKPYDGQVSGKPGAWKVTHNSCVPVADHAKYLGPTAPAGTLITPIRRQL